MWTEKLKSDPNRYTKYTNVIKSLVTEPEFEIS